MLATILNSIQLAGFVKKYWKQLLIAAAVVGVLLGSHFAVYKWATASCEAKVNHAAAVASQEARANEAVLRTNSDAIVKEYHEKVILSDVEINQLKKDLDHALRNTDRCSRATPDPAVRVWSEAVRNEALPPNTDQPYPIGKGNATPGTPGS